MDDLELIRSFRLNDAIPSPIARAAARERLLAHMAKAPMPIAVPDTADGLIAAIDGGIASPESLVPACVDLECEWDRENDCHAAGAPRSQPDSATPINRITLALCVVLAVACVVIGGGLLARQPDDAAKVRARAMASWVASIAYREPDRAIDSELVSDEGRNIWLRVSPTARLNDGELGSGKHVHLWVESGYLRPTNDGKWVFGKGGHILVASAYFLAAQPNDGEGDFVASTQFPELDERLTAASNDAPQQRRGSATATPGRQHRDLIASDRTGSAEPLDRRGDFHTRRQRERPRTLPATVRWVSATTARPASGRSADHYLGRW